MEHHATNVLSAKNLNEESQTSALIVEQKWSKANPYSSTEIKES